jgi:hypothetical protein
MPKSSLATTQFNIPTETDWNALSLTKYEALLAEVRASADAGAKIYSQRSTDHTKKEYCVVCKSELPTRVEHGRTIYNPIYTQSKRNPRTGVTERESICSQGCYMRAAQGGMFKPINAAAANATIK